MLLMLFSQIMVLYTFVAVLGFLVVLSFVFTISMQCSLQRQFNYQTIINKHRHFVLVDSSLSSCGFKESLVDKDDNFVSPRLTRLSSLCPARVIPAPQR